MQRVVTSAAALCLAITPLARAQIVQIERGASDSFGPGFTALAETKVDFRLTRPAHVALLWVGAAGQIDVYWPLRGRDKSDRRAGRHAISVGEVKSPLEPPTIAGAPASSTPGQIAPLGSGTIAGSRAPDEAAGYWVLIVTDAPIVASHLRAWGAPISREGGGEAVLERLPEAVLVGRYGMWAMYAAPVAY